MPPQDTPAPDGSPAPTAPRRGDPDDRPFIICTLQRTGGTNLTRHLAGRSPFRMAQHEPFNFPRVHGAVSRTFRDTGDADALRAAIREIVPRDENMKHCVEMVPWPVSQVLIEEALAAGYRFLFLIRRDRTGRLLSMEYAHRTKVWGPSHVDKVAQDAEAFRTPLDIPAMIAHETRCVRRLNRAWALLESRGAAPARIAFEDIYGPDADLAAARIGMVLAALGLGRGAEADAAMLADLRGQGDQNTRDRYARFKGVAKLRTAVAAMDDFAFDIAAP